MMEKDKALQLHRNLEFIGLRAQATSVGLLQLCAELARANVIDNQAVGRIKEAIHRDIIVSNPRGRDRAEFARTLRLRLDDVFHQAEALDQPTHVGTTHEFQSALEGDAPTAREIH